MRGGVGENMGRVYIVYIKALKMYKKKKSCYVLRVQHSLRQNKLVWVLFNGRRGRTKADKNVLLCETFFFFSSLMLVFPVCVDSVGNYAGLYLFVDSVRGRDVS